MCCMFARSTTLTAYLLYKLKNTGSKSNISNILGSKMRVLCYIYKNILWVENPSEVLIVNSVQTGPIRRPVCLSIGTHSSLQGGRFDGTPRQRLVLPKKEGKHLSLSLLATQRYTDSQAMFKGGRYGLIRACHTPLGKRNTASSNRAGEDNK